MSLDLRGFDLFLAVSEAGSLTKAAKVLNIPLSTLSKRIMDLETGLGLKLLHRSTRKIQLTEDGYALIGAIQGPLLELRAAGQAIHDRSKEPSGRLRISAAPAVAEYILPKVIPSLIENYPNLEIEIGAGAEVRDLRDGAVDIALRVGDSNSDSSLVVRKLRLGKQYIVATPNYLKARGEPKESIQLREHNLIGYVNLDAWKFAGIDHQDKVVRVRSPSATLARQLCLAGLGMAVLPDFIIDNDLKDGAVHSVSLDKAPAVQVVAVVFAPEQRRLPRLRAFLSALSDAELIGA